MTRTKRRLFHSVVLMVSIGMMAWSYCAMTGAREVAGAAASDLRACQAAASEVRALRDRPSVACDHERLASEILTRAENAAAAAGITPEKLVRISPEPPQRIQDSVYKEKPTSILLKDVSLGQIVAMIHRLADGKESLTPKTIQLQAPRTDDSSDCWSAEVVLTYLIFDPPSPGK